MRLSWKFGLGVSIEDMSWGFGLEVWVGGLSWKFGLRVRDKMIEPSRELEVCVRNLSLSYRICSIVS